MPPARDAASPPPAPPPRPGRTRQAAAFALIAAVCGLSATAFAYTGGWLSPDRLTPARIVDALSDRGGDPIGHRRNHSKGICFLGTFEASGAGTALSTASVLARGSYPVVGRFAIATGDPMAADASGRVRSLAVRIVAPDGQEWRSGMNNSPVFVVATPRAFYEQTVASEVDPATGHPDPKALAHFFATHPESAPFLAWAKTAPWTTSFADQQYNSLNAFRFIDASGASHPVRWSLVPTAAPQVEPVAALAAKGPDFLEQDLKARLARGPLTWHLVATLAAPGDPTDDATKAWPADRSTVDLGTLEVMTAQDEATGACRDINYDPTILPTGIAPSDDPLLAARSAVYANSFDRRTAELARHAAAAGSAR